jgi:CubicO group peptidase (beta-lactamase class C family)
LNHFDGFLSIYRSINCYMKKIFGLIFVLLIACKGGDPIPSPTSTALYFPTSIAWETVSPASLGWDETKIPELRTFLAETNTRALIVLKDGKIVMEEYLGKQLVNTNADFSSTSNWYWASAGKTLTAALIGIAESQNEINLDAKTSDYLGVGWTSLAATQENQITVRHQLTMTTGLDDAVSNPDCIEPACLAFKAAPDSRWAYHNAPYTLLDEVITSATGKNLTTYVTDELKSQIGMEGQYIQIGNNNVFFSPPRAMARFGLLLLNQGKWGEEQVVPESYFNLMISSSQNINPAYGYLTWLNGKDSYRLPQSQITFPGMISPDASADMFAAMGKNGQIINVVPSQNIVVVRMGDDPGTGLVPFIFQNDLWQKLNAIIED